MSHAKLFIHLSQGTLKLVVYVSLSDNHLNFTTLKLSHGHFILTKHQPITIATTNDPNAQSPKN